MKFSISILAYQNIALTKRCIASVLAFSKDYELLLTDNGCEDGTAAYFDELAKKHPEIVTVFHNAKNEGFIEPNRRAFGVAKGQYLVLLNNDTVVPPDWLETLHAAFLVEPDCALCGPSGACCQLRTDFHGEIGPRFEYLEGSCLMIDVAKVRPLEPRLFPPELIGAYGEDSYLSLRVRSAGYSIQRVPLMLTHVRAATSAIVPQCREWQANNHTFLAQRWAKYMRSRRFDHPAILRRRAAWGDVLLVTPIIRALKKKNKLTQISVETICAGVFNGNPDVAYVAPSVAVTSGDTEDHNLNGIFEMNPGRHIVDAYASAVGLKEGEYDKVTKIYPPGGDVEWAKRTITTKDWVAIHPGPTTWRCKNWPSERWVSVIQYLQMRGMKVLLVGNDALPPFKNDLDLRGKTTVGQLAAIIGECRLFIGVDSFPIHVAQAMGIPVLGLFGITTPSLLLTDGSPWRAVTSPPDHPATGLRHKKAGLSTVDHPENPMEAITSDAVILEIETCLASCPKTQD